MPKIRYRTFKFKPETLERIDKVNQIVQQYAAQGIYLTLRGIYYQFVSRDWFPESWKDPKTGSTNNEKSYDKLGNIIADGRLAGLIDWDGVVDRTRQVRELNSWRNPQTIVKACSEQFRLDKWANQDHYIEVWVEKDAALGSIETVCNENFVPYMSCRGYASASEIWTAGHNRFKPRVHKKKCHVLYLGDHDPSGLDMPRDLQERLDMFTRAPGGVSLERLALNMDQVDQYNPPPNPTKMTDSRAAKYVEEYGETCWELDALDPVVIRDLIQNAIDQYKDVDRWQEALDEEKEARGHLASIARNWEDVVDNLPVETPDDDDVEEPQEEAETDAAEKPKDDEEEDYFA